MTLVTRSLWIVVTGALGAAAAIALLAALNRLALGAESFSPGLTPGAEGVDARLIAALLLAAAIGAAVSMLVAPRILERAGLRARGTARTFIAFIAGNAMTIAVLLIGRGFGQLILVAAALGALAAYGPLVNALLEQDDDGAAVAAGDGPGKKGATLSPLEIAALNTQATLNPTPTAPPAPPPPTPRAPRPPAAAAPAATPPATPAAAAQWLIDMAMWSATLDPLLARAQAEGAWGEVAAECRRASDFSENLPASGDAAIDAAMGHLQQALRSAAAAADPASAAAAIVRLGQLRQQVINDPRAQRFVSLHRDAR